MRWLLTLLTWVITVAVLAPVCFIVTMVLAGPHSSILPSSLQPLVLALGWIVFLVCPVLAARAVWRRRAPAS